jgi:Cu+-exporting ATPase
LAEAIVTGALERGASISPTDSFESRTGRGVIGRVAGRTIALGNRKMLDEMGVSAGALAEHADELRQEGQTAMFVVVDGSVDAILGVADPIKESTPDAIAALHGEGLRVVMLTGDNRKTADAVAARLSIDEVIAEVLASPWAPVRT